METTQPPSYRLLVCVNPIGSNKPSCGGDRGSQALADALESGIRDRRINAQLDRIICLNRCLKGPALRIAPGGDFFLEVQTDHISKVLDRLESLAGLLPDGVDPTEPEAFDPTGFGQSYPGQ
ncbi:MAG: (2Fe-2S) ferredoxin domain-containing protein [Alphaproteobacteria bacterium]|nr:(2Fe-2S) ferredoxin domain-containing protein [Alphaproteobacteria bacterium]